MHVIVLTEPAVTAVSVVTMSTFKFFGIATPPAAGRAVLLITLDRQLAKRMFGTFCWQTNDSFEEILKPSSQENATTVPCGFRVAKGTPVGAEVGACVYPIAVGVDVGATVGVAVVAEIGESVAADGLAVGAAAGNKRCASGTHCANSTPQSTG